ncbi:hypothetical protein N0V88_001412 [Collariella sp. IMI 366227]|nr:hypothetical protein N0V88_001412 [Collariella sp. IMI 366227]
MRLSTAATLLACAASQQAHAFSDSSPFILFSTAEYVPSAPLNPTPTNSKPPPPPHNPPLLLASCPTSRYLLVSQPNLHVVGQVGGKGLRNHELGKMLGNLGGEDYTVMVYSDPNEFKAYEPEFAAPVHMDMKRWAEQVEVMEKKKGNATSGLPLFKKYQFFTPGIFMSLIVLLVILSILGVGLKALASLEVSYGAFDKEMGPAAQKKQM